MSYKNPIQWSMIYTNTALYAPYRKLLEELARRMRRDLGEVENAIYYRLCPEITTGEKKRTACYKKFESLKAMEPYLLTIAFREIYRKSKLERATVSLHQTISEEGGTLLDFLEADGYDCTLDDKIEWLFGCLKGIARNRKDKLAPLAQYLLDHWGAHMRQKEMARVLGVNQGTVSRWMRALGERILGQPNDWADPDRF